MGLPENRSTYHRRPQEGLQETTGKLNIKSDAKFYVKLAARGKANMDLYSESGVWSTRNAYAVAR